MINLLFTTSNHWISKLIKFRIKEPVSHVALQINQNLVIHATFSGIKIESFQEFKKSNNIIFSLPIEDKTDNLYLDNLAKYVGIKYDFLNIIWLFFFVKTGLANKWQNSKKYTCVEFVTEVLFNVADSTSTPYELYLKLKKKYN